MKNTVHEYQHANMYIILCRVDFTMISYENNTNMLPDMLHLANPHTYIVGTYVIFGPQLTNVNNFNFSYLVCTYVQ